MTRLWERTALETSPKGLINGPWKVLDEHHNGFRGAAGRAPEGCPQGRGLFLSSHPHHHHHPRNYFVWVNVNTHCHSPRYAIVARKCVVMPAPYNVPFSPSRPAPILSLPVCPPNHHGDFLPSPRPTTSPFAHDSSRPENHNPQTPFSILCLNHPPPPHHKHIHLHHSSTTSSPRPPPQLNLRHFTTPPHPHFLPPWSRRHLVSFSPPPLPPTSSSHLLPVHQEAQTFDIPSPPNEAADLAVRPEVVHQVVGADFSVEVVRVRRDVQEHVKLPVLACRRNVNSSSRGPAPCANKQKASEKELRQLLSNEACLMTTPMISH